MHPGLFRAFWPIFGISGSIQGVEAYFWADPGVGAYFGSIQRGGCQGVIPGPLGPIQGFADLFWGFREILWAHPGGSGTYFGSIQVG